MDASTLFLGLIFGSVGAGYFIYGKRQQRIMALVSGIILCAIPYVVSSVAVLTIAGLVAAALPFFIKS